MRDFQIAFNYQLVYFPVWKCIVAADEVYIRISLAIFIVWIDLYHHTSYICLCVLGINTVSTLIEKVGIYQHYSIVTSGITTGC